MTSPLLQDGSNFACKHYQNSTDSYVTKATYTPGGTYDMWLNGTVEHDGGSCQLSLSYDNGVTFKVIKSMIGGCPLTHTYNFTIPEFAPASDSALLSWSWFNLIGNRDMYQNCARVQIANAPSRRYRRSSSYNRRQASSIDQLPDMFVCNVNNGCQTIEREEVVFPDAGTDVLFGQDAVTPDPGPGFTINGDSTTPSNTTAAATTSTSATSTLVPSNTTTTSQTGVPKLFPTFNSTGSPDTNNNSTGNQTAPTAMPFNNSTTLTNSTTSMNLTSFLPSSNSTPPTDFTTVTNYTLHTTNNTTFTPTPAVFAVPTTFVTSFIPTAPTTTTFPTPAIYLASPNTTSFSASAATAAVVASSVPCIPGTYICNSPNSFSQCIPSSNGTTIVYMGAVAVGMSCVDGQIVSDESSS